MSEEKKNNHFQKAQKKKVVLLGTAPSCKDAPFDDPNFEIWGVAHCLFLGQVTRLDGIFELHTKDIWIKDNAPYQRFPNAWVYLQQQDESVKNSLTFPLEEIRKRFKVNAGFSHEADYFSSSLPFMICMAIERGFEEIHCYGIHLLMDEEYFYQRPCFEYYLGVARGKGIKVFVHPAADILKFPYIYGWQDMTDEARKIRDRLNEFEARLKTLLQRREATMIEMERQINQLIGAKEDCYYFLRNHGIEATKKQVIF
jgi:hypothetical protein